ncbi:helix-turn-helix transcriptional regulator [Kluyvera genomosp. 3]|uniref:Helix-turn-helix transcriptional regulator n=1 Tax=Kluyvera genomosp. 3 TaxID=2774055 RepID=A0A6G9RL62_9ENTR|nr:helix-turn-helix transcriptional regulator [Kluyvera genomosp. 3]QIR27650.1 helix-turn-helix transcriptional regulator [Kluyvera genomosp. 3]
MNKYEIRRQRLLYIRDRLCNGRAIEIARKIGREPSYVSRMLYPEGKKQKKRIADGMIELIESSFDLPRGWMDGITGEIPEDYIHKNYVVEALNIEQKSYLSTEVNAVVDSINFIPNRAMELFGSRPAEQMKVMSYSADAMAGTIGTGDIIVVDIDKNSFEGDGIYLFACNQVLQVRRLQLVGEALRVRADNNLYADWLIDEKQKRSLTIIGRVIYCYAVKRFV